MNATTSTPAIRLRLRLPATQQPFRRADLVFLGLEHAGPSVEVRIFFNAPDADASTPTTAAAGFAGFFSIFAHGGCFGDEGHCDMPERRPNDLRPPYALTPFTKHVTVTEPSRQLLADRLGHRHVLGERGERIGRPEVVGSPLGHVAVTLVAETAAVGEDGEEPREAR